MIKENVYQVTEEEILQNYETDPEQGLTQEEAEKRIKKYGENIIDSGDKVSPWKILLDKVHNLIVYLLIGSIIISFIMGDVAEGIAIIIAVFIAVFFGFFTELRAQKSMEALQNMIHTKVKVYRNGELKEINSSELVPGDIIQIESGDALTADGRLLESTNLSIMEASLTGESQPVDKDAEFISDEKLSLGDRINQVFAGTAATRGAGKAVITHTGMKTEVGKISEMMKEGKESGSPLDRELHKMGKYLIIFAAISAVIVAGLGILRGDPAGDIIHIALILAVSAIPEAMPAVSTMTLARGMKQMSKKDALVKILSSVETLGSTSVICSDKTGTMTENEMTATEIFLKDGKSYDVEGLGYDPKGSILEGGKEIKPEGLLKDFILSGILNNEAVLEEEEGEYKVNGDPTDGALLILGKKAGLDFLDEFKKIGSIPFDSENKYMVTAFEADGEVKAYIKGAFDVLLDHEKDKSSHDDFKKANEQFAKEGMRVIAVGELKDYRGDGSVESLEEAISQTEILGLAGIVDPPREDVMESVAVTQEAGIQIKMITGDHPETASAIASEIGIANSDNTLTGMELDEMFSEEPDDLHERISKTAVFARVSPENKLQIVKSLRSKGKIVAMTGDGVNDGPALNGADIGVAMGIRGTEVAKEASDIVLTDDRFSTIVDAVELGRIIFANIKKFVSFLFTCCLVEIVATILSILFLLPVPVQPIHILWLNLVIDLSPAMAFAMEPKEGDIMKEYPRESGEGLLNKKYILQILLNGILIAVVCFLAFRTAVLRGYQLEHTQTLAFVMMGMAQLSLVFNIRRSHKIGLDKTLFKNLFMIGALALSTILLLIAVYLPFFNALMPTVPLTVTEWGVIVLLSVLLVFVNEGINRFVLKTKKPSKAEE